MANYSRTFCKNSCGTTIYPRESGQIMDDLGVGIGETKMEAIYEVEEVVV